MTRIVDDKSQWCVPFVLERLDIHRQRYADVENAPPFFLGLSGVQGAGKTTLDLIHLPIEGSGWTSASASTCHPLPDVSAQVSIIQKTIEKAPYNLHTVAFSLDDLYLTHADQVKLANQYPENPLLQHRGLPSTHDVHLAKTIFSCLRQNSPASIPRYNKSAIYGRGDRAPEAEWQRVNGKGQSKVNVVLFEGWAVGFRPLGEQELRLKWERAVMDRKAGHYLGRLGHNTLDNVAHINTALAEYDQITDQLDAIIHIDASDLQHVYKWRLEQEADLRASKGSGMTDEEVKNFVDAYYPAYELFAENLRSGIFGAGEGRQLRLVIGEDRKVREVIII